VGEALAQKGVLALGTIISTSGLPVRSVKEALFILIQHNLVHFSNGSLVGETAGGSVGPSTTYQLDIDAVLGRLWFPLIHQYVERNFEASSVEVFTELLQNGRLRYQSCMNGLLEAGILETVMMEEFSDSHPEGAAAPPPSSASPLTKKRKTQTTSSPIKMLPNSNRLVDNLSFVRFNLKGSRHCLQTEILTEHVRNATNEGAAAVLRSALSLPSGKPFGPFQVSTRFAPASKQQLLVEHDDHGGGGGSNGRGKKDEVHIYLDLLCQEYPFVLKLDNRADGSYQIDSEKASAYLQHALVEAYIRGRYGQPSARIFSIVQGKQLAEEKTISKVAMITPKDCRERLYQMLTAGLLSLQEVPRTADHAPSRTFYLWQIPKSKTVTMVEFHLAAIRHLISRATFERDQNRTLVMKSERSDVAADPSLMSLGERQQLLTLRKTLDRLAFHQHQLVRDLTVFV
jgi:DNA-directed RNA polymerase III subunit RPC3